MRRPLSRLVTQKGKRVCCVTRPNNGCEEDYRKPSTNSNTIKYLCLSLFQINWMGFFHSLLNNIFFGIKEMLFFFYENANAIYLVSHFKLPIQKDNSGIRSMPMFNLRNKHSSLRQCNVPLSLVIIYYGALPL